MKSNNLVRLLSGASSIIYNSSQIIADKAKEVIAEHTFSNQYVTREEFDNLKEVVIKLQALVNKTQNVTITGDSKKESKNS